MRCATVDDLESKWQVLIHIFGFNGKKSSFWSFEKIDKHGRLEKNTLGRLLPGLSCQVLHVETIYYPYSKLSSTTRVPVTRAELKRYLNTS